MKQEGETLILTGDVGSISLATLILAEPRPRDSTVKAPEQTTAKQESRVALSSTGIGGRAQPGLQAVRSHACSCPP